MTSPVDHLRPLLEALTLEQKAALVQGADFWTTVPLPEIGLRAMTLSDGPAGVRGPRWDEREPSLNLPSGSALAASWDVDLAYRYGAAAAAEARAKDVDVVLGPTINLHRSPLGGRHFECFSEDPELSGALAAAYVAGLQDNGVAACPKHYVANDSETDRFTVDVEVEDRALRELYLAPFERAVTEAHAWSIMSAYNAVDGVTMTENDLLETPLNSEWGFDGVVISDWTAVRSLDAVAAAQDLAMPGPAPAWADLVAAVGDGRVAEEDLDRKVLRLLLLAERVGALGDAGPAGRAAVPAIDGPAFARDAAVAGTVLLRNDGTLPLEAASLGSVAVIGQNARDARTQGGGSATVVPAHVVSPLEGLRAALPGVEVSYELGALVQDGVVEIPLAQLQNPVTGEPGLRVRFLDDAGTELFAEDRRSTALVWFGGDAPIAASRTVVFETRFTPAETGAIELGFAGANPGRLFVDGELVLDDSPVIEGTDLGAAFLNPPSLTTTVAVTAGAPRDIRVEFTCDPQGALAGALSATVGIAPTPTPDAELVARAVAAAASADVAVVVVGTTSRVESEGYDRESLDLPGAQDALVRAVAATGTPTIVVVNAGSPVALPWAQEVSAVVQGYFGGQEFGHAIADVLTGAREPGGRLPTTWPATLADVPVVDVTPQDGVLRYREGIHIGYRAWLKEAAAPAFPFGHGLGYTTWSWDDAQRDGDAVAVTLTNTGARTGKQVVQVYAERAASAVERPERWLVGFAAVELSPGETGTVSVPLPDRRLAYWDGGGWRVEPGTYTLRVGASVVDLPLAASWTVTA
ncbi:glycoside hydrolase family 3 C-terminal domain-containing protein [Microbacterium hominis]|uniref:beta-glucosidase H n=1 Tax=Microbacterium TaxID=33882 RepID=UPI00168A9823|nr:MULTISPECIES: glycoside hydrolase family 3 C-terminal domain-containing protein [Microbacterium]QOC27242.1 glycoside hydrolase family 3 C-terminal domain-containing protein [Microbacterium hominis]QOC28387.1 glycoside hydrolase family 3 C-terminal domain-containing protein [Microbacterium hominis]QYF96421.1 glycoside hydrolase family 3 C-terminal domain-containing protein [Microbacterium sp. PAMC21962]